MVLLATMEMLVLKVIPVRQVSVPDRTLSFVLLRTNVMLLEHVILLLEFAPTLPKPMVLLAMMEMLVLRVIPVRQVSVPDQTLLFVLLRTNVMWLERVAHLLEFARTLPK